MTQNFAGVSISRQAAGLYLIQDHQVTLHVEGENQD